MKASRGKQPGRKAIVLRNIGWSAITDVLDKAFRFFSLPLLLAGYGRENYGLIAIIFGIRGYLAILSLGTPSGMIRYVARWLQQGDMENLKRCSRTTLSLYVGIGLVNALVFAALGWWGVGLFQVNASQAVLLGNMLLITAGYILIFWPAQMIGHLLTAAEEIHFVQKCNGIRSLLDFLWVLAVVHWHIRLDVYLAVRLAFPVLLLPALIRRWSRHADLRATLTLGWHWQEFRPVVLYGLGVLAISWSHTSFVELRPVLLEMNGASVGVVTDFAVLAAITNLFKLAGSWVAGPLMPSASKALAGGDHKYLDFAVYRGAKYFWAALAFPAMWVMLNSGPLLRLYAGREFEFLGPWLTIMSLSVLEAYLAPLAGIIFAVGRLRPYIWWNAVLSAISLGVVWFGAPSLGVRAAVLATCLYSVCQFVYHQLYFFPKVMQWNSSRLFLETFLRPLLTAAITAAILLALRLYLPLQGTSWLPLAVSFLLAAAIYAALGYFLILSPSERAGLTSHIPGNNLEQPKSGLP